MSQQVDARAKSFIVAAAYAQYALVKPTANADEVTLAGAADDLIIGATEEQTFAAADRVSVALRSKEGTQKVIAAGAFARGAQLYAAASGKVDDSGTVKVGVALEASGGDGEIIEMMWLPPGS